MSFFDKFGGKHKSEMSPSMRKAAEKAVGENMHRLHEEYPPVNTKETGEVMGVGADDMVLTQAELEARQKGEEGVEVPAPDLEKPQA